MCVETAPQAGSELQLTEKHVFNLQSESTGSSGVNNDTFCVPQVLREAKEREELQATEKDSCDPEKVVAHYGMMFDEFQGLSHLEALELLSRESELKVQRWF